MNCLLLCIIYFILFYKQFIKKKSITFSLMVFFLLSFFLIFYILVWCIFIKKLSFSRNFHFRCTFVNFFSFTLPFENNQQNVKS